MKINDVNGRINFLENVNIKDNLEGGNYTLMRDPMTGEYYLHKFEVVLEKNEKLKYVF